MTGLKVTDERLSVIRKLGDPHSINWTTHELAQYFEGHDTAYYSRHCRWLWQNGLATREAIKDGYQYQLTELGRAYLK